jgi:tRNA(Ile)-lysidine synthase
VDVLGVVREAIEREQLLETGATVVVGVSGGPDSVCLLHLLNRLRASYGWSLHVAHLNHCLRGAEADEDMVFVALLAAKWGLPCTVEVADVEAIAQERRLSLEEAARQARYNFLSEAAQRAGASAVAVGHNADDQSETVLMHFLRGAGLAGLRGMLPATDLDLGWLPSPSKVRLVRPLLTVPRAAIQDYCQAHNLSSRFDRSNLDTSYFRNRLRHQLLPLLETFNPNIRTLLRRMASVLAADYELLAAWRDEAWERLVREEGESAISFELAGWRALPLALRRATLRQAAYRLLPQLRDVDFVHVEQAVAVATHGDTGDQATLPQGLRLRVGYHTLRLSGADDVLAAPQWPLLWHDTPLPVAVPGQTTLPGGRWQLQAQAWHGASDAALDNADRWTVYVDTERLGPNPALRPRRPGDRFQPLGMGGRSVGVAEFMINAKIPRRWRAHVPLLVHDRPGSSGEQEIAWVVGWRMDERVKVTAETRRVTRLFTSLQDAAD